MWKAVLAGTTALTIAGSSFVYAQQRDGGFDGSRRWQPNAEDRQAFADARIAALKAGLALSADQEKHWAAYEQAARAFAKQRQERRAERRDDRQSDARQSDQRGSDQRRAEQRRPDPVERMRDRATAMADVAASLKSLADATEPLYSSLNDGQKRRFAILAGPMMPRAGQRGRHHMHRHPGRGDGDNRGRFERFRRGSLDDQPFEAGPHSPTRL